MRKLFGKISELREVRMIGGFGTPESAAEQEAHSQIGDILSSPFSIPDSLQSALDFWNSDESLADKAMDTASKWVDGLMSDGQNKAAAKVEQAQTRLAEVSGQPARPNSLPPIQDDYNVATARLAEDTKVALREAVAEVQGARITVGLGREGANLVTADNMEDARDHIGTQPLYTGELSGIVVQEGQSSKVIRTDSGVFVKVPTSLMSNEF